MVCVSREQISLGELWNLLSPSTESLDLALRIKASSIPTLTRLFVGGGCCQLPSHGHPGLSPGTYRDKATPATAAAALSCSGMAIPRLPRQIRPLERGGGQGCPSAPVFVPQLGLVSPVLTVVHWFPLHVPCGFQTPPRSSSGLSPERFWILAILFPSHLFFPPLSQLFLPPQAHSKSRP